MEIKAYAEVFGEDIEFEFNSPDLYKAYYDAIIADLMYDADGTIKPLAKTKKEAIKIINQFGDHSTHKQPYTNPTKHY